MEKDILPALPGPALYSRTSIAFATMLSGPLAGGYMIAENFKNLNKPAYTRIIWVITIMTLVLILGIAFYVERLPNYALPSICTAIASGSVSYFQQEDITRHREEGGQIFSGWRVLLIGIIGLIITIIPILVITILADAISN